MLHTLPRTVSALVFTLAAGSGHLTAGPAVSAQNLPPAELAALKAQEPARVAQAQSHLLTVRDQLGLGPLAGFTPRTTLTNPQGRTVARFTQTHAGHRVWAGEAIAHVEGNGAIQPMVQGVKTGIALAGAPRLSAAEARAIALRNLAPKGVMNQAPKVEQVVFPTRYTGGLVTRFDATAKRETLDKEMSTWAKVPAEPYVWAYEVRTKLVNKQDGHKELSYIIDGNTGAILRKWSGLQADAADTPAINTGNSFFRGPVPLSTSQSSADGTYTLAALDRGTKPQPLAASQGITQLGMTTYYAYYDLANWNQYSFTPFAGHASSTWGDGTRMPYPYNWSATGWDDPNLWEFSADGNQMYLQGTLSPAGETSAVDAHYGVCSTWDFFKNVFGRVGIDNLDTSTLAVVSDLNPFSGGAFPDNAYWSSWDFGMHFGEGSYDAVHNPTGLLAITELDITAHELSHGVMEYSASLIYAGQSGGINEGNSDFFGKMVQAYVEGGATGASVPDFPAGDLTKWEVGHNSAPPGGSGFRFMFKQSKDGISADQHFDGIDMLDVHYSSGVFNRAMFFLTSGASASAASETYSPFLPQGMTGIGNDKAARIWYKAITEHLASDADFAAARAAAILSAQELYGAGSPEELAVWKAWAGVNVGPATPTESARVWVSWPTTNPAGSWFYDHAADGSRWTNLQLYPTRTLARLKVDVANTTNTAVTYSLGSYRMNGQDMGGLVSPEGIWTTPSITYYGDIIKLQATSQAAPDQFALGKAMLVEADADMSTELDVFDLGYVAMNWGLNVNSIPKFTANVGGSYDFVDDWSVVLFNQAYTNAFRLK
ncbi:MAG: M4 family metallopeptidase [Geothrix sp.]|nr:M4 family metallopeptidase [Geothrix sp.]